jgi:predicted PurR-regulated permease PerM
MLAFLSSIIAVSLSIPVNRLQRFGLRRGPAVGITVVTALILVISFVTWILPTLVVQMADLVTELPDAFDTATASYNEWHEGQNSTIQELLPRGDSNEIERMLGIEDSGLEDIISVEDAAGFLLPVLRGASNVLVGVVANLVIVFFVSLFLLLDPMDYARGAIMLVPQPYQKRAVEVLVELRITLTAWLTAQSISIVISGTLVYVILGLIIGVPNALAIAALAGLMTFIPNIGSLVPLIPIVIFTLADDPAKTPFALIAYFVIQQVESNVITPTIVKERLSIPAGALFIFQLISATLFGFFGILLAVPLLATLITLVRELYVYDALGMRGVSVDIETIAPDKLRLVTTHHDDKPPMVWVLDTDDPE